MVVKAQLALLLLTLFGNYFNRAYTLTSIKDEETMLLRELSGTCLRFSSYPYNDPPWFKIEEEPNGTLTYSGSMKQIADSMVEILNVTVLYVRVQDAEANVFGPKEASVNMLLRNEIDVVARPMMRNLDHCSRMDCSLTLYFEGNKLMVPWPDEETHIISPIRPFQSQVWIALLGSIIAVSLAMGYYLQKYDQNNNNNSNLDGYHYSLIYILTGEGDWSRWKKLSFRIIQGSWCLAALVLVNAYSTTVISNLVAPKLMPVSKSYEDIVAGQPQQLILITEKNELVDRSSQVATSGVFKALGDQFRKNPESLFVDREEGFEKLFKGGYAYKGINSRVEAFMSKAFKRAGGQCRFTISNDSTDPESAQIWGFHKNWRYTNAVNNKLKWFPESGLVNFWVKNYDSPRSTSSCKLDKENNRKNKDDNRKKLTLSHLSGPFIFLIAGSAFSFLIFLIEIIYNKIMI